jgi:hypothetical protein
MNHVDFESIIASLVASATMDWPHPPPVNTHELMRALQKVVRKCVLKGAELSTNQPAPNKGRPIDGILPVLSVHR